MLSDQAGSIAATPDCGDPSPRMRKGYAGTTCALPQGHRGWHRDADNQQWTLNGDEGGLRQLVHGEDKVDPWTLPPRREPKTWDLRRRRWGNNIDLIRRDEQTGEWEALLIASGGPYGVSRPAPRDLVLLKAKDGSTLTYRIERCRPMSDPDDQFDVLLRFTPGAVTGRVSVPGGRLA